MKSKKVLFSTLLKYVIFFSIIETQPKLNSKPIENVTSNASSSKQLIYNMNKNDINNVESVNRPNSNFNINTNNNTFINEQQSAQNTHSSLIRANSLQTTNTLNNNNNNNNNPNVNRNLNFATNSNSANSNTNSNYNNSSTNSISNNTQKSMNF